MLNLYMNWIRDLYLTSHVKCSINNDLLFVCVTFISYCCLRNQTGHRFYRIEQRIDYETIYFCIKKFYSIEIFLLTLFTFTLLINDIICIYIMYFQFMETDLDNKEYDPYEVSRTLMGKIVI